MQYLLMIYQNEAEYGNPIGDTSSASSSGAYSPSASAKWVISVIDFVACGAMVPKVQVSVPVSSAQFALSVPPTVQVSPAGSVSIRTTLVELVGPYRRTGRSRCQRW